MSINGSGVITLNSNADYEQKTSYAATVSVSDSVGSTSKSLNVNIADITEYPTINIRSWYDDVTLPSCTDNIMSKFSRLWYQNTNIISCGDNTEFGKTINYSSDANLRVILPPSEWTSLTSTESNTLPLEHTHL